MSPLPPGTNASDADASSPTGQQAQEAAIGPHGGNLASYRCPAPQILDGAIRALRTAAYVVDRHGLAYLPLFTRLEAEVVRLTQDDPLARARAILTAAE